VGGGGGVGALADKGKGGAAFSPAFVPRVGGARGQREKRHSPTTGGDPALEDVFPRRGPFNGGTFLGQRDRTKGGGFAPPAARKGEESPGGGRGAHCLFTLGRRKTGGRTRAFGSFLKKKPTVGVPGGTNCEMGKEKGGRVHAGGGGFPGGTLVFFYRGPRRIGPSRHTPGWGATGQDPGAPATASLGFGGGSNHVPPTAVDRGLWQNPKQGQPKHPKGGPGALALLSADQCNRAGGCATGETFVSRANKAGPFGFRSEGAHKEGRNHTIFLPQGRGGGRKLYVFIMVGKMGPTGVGAR